jgi:heme exporter protein D|tara:strand:- start:147 stop:281 length:135 start_codon:yes stop_codon:yes gene_type:complete
MLWFAYDCLEIYETVVQSEWKKAILRQMSNQVYREARAAIEHPE